MRSVLVVSEVALAFVALVGAGLFVGSFRAASAIDPGFDASNVLVSEIQFATSGYSAEQRQDFCDRLRARLESRPGIQAVSYANRIPLGFGTGGVCDVEIEGYVPRKSELMTIGSAVVAPGYFSLMRIPLIAGRDFTERDAVDVKPGIIVSQAFAKRFYGSQNPVGRKVRVSGLWADIIGIAKDSKYYYLSDGPRPYVFVPLHRTTVPTRTALFVRTPLDPAEAIKMLRREAAALDADILTQTMPLSDYITGPLFAHKIAAVMLTVLSAVAILLSAVGLYSMMAYAVGERTHEIGIRVALGAASTTVLSVVIRKAMMLAAAGVLIGIATAYGSAQLVSSMLIGVSATDAGVFLGAALFLGLIALLASSFPAIRASRVDPMIALRHE